MRHCTTVTQHCAPMPCHLSLHHCVTVSLCHCLTVSPCHSVLVSLLQLLVLNETSVALVAACQCLGSPVVLEHIQTVILPPLRCPPQQATEFCLRLQVRPGSMHLGLRSCRSVQLTFTLTSV